MDIVTLGFVKNLTISGDDGSDGGAVVSFCVELTTPACPVKEVGLLPLFHVVCEVLTSGGGRMCMPGSKDRCPGTPANPSLFVRLGGL